MDKQQGELCCQSKSFLHNQAAVKPDDLIEKEEVCLVLILAVLLATQ